MMNDGKQQSTFFFTITRSSHETHAIKALHLSKFLFGTQFGTQRNSHITGQSSNSPERASLMM